MNNHNLDYIVTNAQQTYTGTPLITRRTYGIWKHREEHEVWYFPEDTNVYYRESMITRNNYLLDYLLPEQFNTATSNVKSLEGISITPTTLSYHKGPSDTPSEYDYRWSNNELRNFKATDNIMQRALYLCGQAATLLDLVEQRQSK
jgi:hypothetical protein